jgi:heterodisulfide reductase subunit A
MIRLSINEQTVEVDQGTTLLEACRKLSINIPTLCYYQAIEPYGGCRLCLVEIVQGGRSRLTTACTAPAEEGLTVVTHSNRVIKARQMTMELLLARCPEVPEIQRTALQLGVRETRFKKEDQQCILCGKCVRVCQELMGVGAIGLVNRGSEKLVSTPFNQFSEICRTCGACAFVCPTGAISLDKITARIPKIRGSEFNLGLSERPNIYKPFPQAVPAMPAIDAKNCVHFLTGDCGACEKFCPAGAIDYQQKPREITIDVGAIIASPGFETFDARLKGEYGYGRYPNVITSLEFERFLSASGPYAGHVQRPSDGHEPTKVAWIQCVGSRDASIDQDYCSTVCCMVATKQAIIAKEHVSTIEPAIFFIDLRAQGKGFDRYYERAKKDHGVRYVRSLLSRVTENPRTHNLQVSYIDEGNLFQTEEFDLVILSVGLKPHSEAWELATAMRIRSLAFSVANSGSA